MPNEKNNNSLSKRWGRWSLWRSKAVAWPLRLDEFSRRMFTLTKVHLQEIQFVTDAGVALAYRIYAWNSSPQQPTWGHVHVVRRVGANMRGAFVPPLYSHVIGYDAYRYQKYWRIDVYDVRVWWRRMCFESTDVYFVVNWFNGKKRWRTWM